VTLATPRPFVRWVGGKRRTYQAIRSRLPDRIETYVEPFVGGGAVFFGLAREGAFRRALLNDANPELANAFTVVRDDVERLIASLVEWQVEPDRAAGRDLDEQYKGIAALDPEDLDPVTRAARFLYLNRLAYNGLYRVNKAGGYNVPRDPGRTLKVGEANLRACSIALRRAVIRCHDFGAVLDAVRLRPGDAVYLDPPYLKRGGTSFTAYTVAGFTFEDHRRLNTYLRRYLDDRVAAVLSNADTSEARDLFAGLAGARVNGSGSVNSNTADRGPTRDLLIEARAGGIE